MTRGLRRACQGLLAAAALLAVADLASRLAYSEAAVAAQADMALRRTVAIQSGVAETPSDRLPTGSYRRPRLREARLEGTGRRFPRDAAVEGPH